MKAVKSKIKGRASMGYYIGIKNSIVNFSKVICMKNEYSVIQLNDNFRKVIIIFSYLPPNSNIEIEEIFQAVDSAQISCIYMGDFNSRTGNHTSKSNDKVTNLRGTKLIKIIQENNLSLLNGNGEHGTDGDFTFVNKNGSSVVDLCITSQSITDKKEFKVLSSEQSCHFPIMLKLNAVPHFETLTKIVRVEWDVHKIGQFQDNFDNILENCESSNITIDKFQQGMLKGIDSCEMLKRRILGVKNITYGPR